MRLVPFILLGLLIGIAPFLVWFAVEEIVFRVRFRRLRERTLRELDDLMARHA